MSYMLTFFVYARNFSIFKEFPENNCQVFEKLLKKRQQFLEKNVRIGFGKHFDKNSDVNKTECLTINTY